MSAPASVPSDPSSETLLRRFSAFATGAVVFLICLGAQVTSEEAGMSVPDWPTSYGYNMFDLPFRFWKHGAQWEHSHRLVASGFGVITVILAVLVGFKERRSWVRNLAFGALGAVVLQGVIGGLRVVWNYNDLGILHGALAQLILVGVGLIALSYTRSWNSRPDYADRLPSSWQRGAHLLAGLIFCQLVLGAVMRHQHAGLSIPDFPTAYRHLWPHVTPERLDLINANRVAHHMPPTTATQIYLQMAHRATALVIFVGVYVFGLGVLRCRQSPPHLRKLALAWIVLVSLQIVLGAATVLTGKNPWVTSGHVVNGALLLLAGSHIAALITRWRRAARPEAPETGPGPGPELVRPIPAP